MNWIFRPQAQGSEGSPCGCKRQARLPPLSAHLPGPRWDYLAGKGATPQRVLWASTSTKNPDYSDTLYVDELIGPDTINTMPGETVKAFQDHGSPRPSLQDALAEASALLEQLAELGSTTTTSPRRLSVRVSRSSKRPSVSCSTRWPRSWGRLRLCERLDGGATRCSCQLDLVSIRAGHTNPTPARGLRALELVGLGASRLAGAGVACAALSVSVLRSRSSGVFGIACGASAAIVLAVTPTPVPGATAPASDITATGAGSRVGESTGRARSTAAQRRSRDCWRPFARAGASRPRAV